MKKRISYSLYLLVSVLLPLEIFLQAVGYKPGVYQDLGAKRVDSLIVYNNYTTDSFGVYKYSSWVSDTIPKYLREKFGNLEESDIEQFGLGIDDDILPVFNDFGKLHDFGVKFRQGSTAFLEIDHRSHFELYTCEFASCYLNILAKEPHEISFYDSLILEYVKQPINEEGFRSIAFSPKQKLSRKKVLILGDSFAFGDGSDPIYNSFADILLARGYLVYNTGITGTNPAQYLANAIANVSSFRPDIVVANFYPGNDIMDEFVSVDSTKPPDHFTNAGYFLSHYNGKYHSPSEIYQVYLNQTEIPSRNNRFNWICAQTSTTSRIWAILFKLGLVDNQIVDNEPQQVVDGEPEKDVNKPDSIEVTKFYFDEIQKVCAKNEVILLNVIIPDCEAERASNGNVLLDFGLCDQIFGAGRYSFRNDFNDEDFAGSDIHFNNNGYLKYANYVDSLIQDTLGLSAN
jgi:hypothetical protein